MFYDLDSNYGTAKSLENGTSKVMRFKTDKVWTDKNHKRNYFQYKLTPSQVKQINFETIQKKLASVKEPKGKKRRNAMIKEDQEMFAEYFYGKSKK